MADLTDDYGAIDSRTDSIISSFDAQFSSVLARAQIRTSLQMRRLLTVEDDGTIKPTVQNIRALRQLPNVFRKALTSEGYDTMVSSFLVSFNGGLPRMEKILGKIAKAYDVAAPEFGKQDYLFFAELKKNTALNLEAM